MTGRQRADGTTGDGIFTTIVYAVRNERGPDEEFVLDALQTLRSLTDRLVVVAPGPPRDSAAASIADTLEWTSEQDRSIGSMWAHGISAAVSQDEGEIVLTGDDSFWHSGRLKQVSERMRGAKGDAWAMTERLHGDERTVGEALWLAIRREVLDTAAWHQFWRSRARTLDGGEFEVAFDDMLTESSASLHVAFPRLESDPVAPSFEAAHVLVSRGAPLLRVDLFRASPARLDRAGIVPRWALDAAEAASFKLLPILRHLARSTAPRLLNTNGALLNVLAVSGSERTRDHTMRIAVVAHIFYEDMVDEIVDLADNLPGPYDLVITTPDQDRARTIREQLASRTRTWGELDVRVLGSNNGRDQGAFLVACRDLIVEDDYDLLVKVHSKKTVQDGFNIGRHFKQQQLLNLLDTPGYVDGLIDMFRNEPALGLVYPPTIHIGYPTMGRGWWSNKSGFASLAAELGITVPLDDVSPLAPYGSMYIARPAALRRMVGRKWSFADFGGADAYQDGGLAHILERLPSYSAAEDGYYTRTVMTADYTAISHTSFEYNLDQLSVTIPGGIDEQVSLIRRLGFFGQGRAADVLRMYLRSHAPKHAHAVDRWETRIRRVRSRLRRS